MRIFADKQTINQAEISKTEATFYPLWSVDSRGAGQYFVHLQMGLNSVF